MRGASRTALASVAVAAVVALIALGLLGNSTQTGSRRVGASGHPTVPVSPSVSSAPRSPGNAAAGWKLKFSSNFSGSQLDTGTWGTCYPWHDLPGGCTNYGNKRPELEWYMPAQDRVVNGALELVAQRLPTQGLTRQGAPVTYECRSGMVTTYPSFRFKYGYIRVVARIPYGYGLWPALWLAAANLKWPPEIDIMEHWAQHPTVRLSVHTLGPAGPVQVTKNVLPANLSVGWHSFALLWSPSKLVWFVDGHTALIVRDHIPDIPMYFIADVADSKQPVSRGCAGTLAIRSVKVWQQH